MLRDIHSVDSYIRANRDAWNQEEPVQHTRTLEELFVAFQQDGYSCLDSTLSDLFNLVDVKNKSVAQLGCSNGRELLSVQNLGATGCVGFDISEKFIQQAISLAATAEIDATFVCANVYEIPSAYENTFDIVFLTAGVLGWMPDIQLFFHQVRRLLKENGLFLAYEMHPILEMFDLQSGNPTDFQHSYFQTEPHVIPVGSSQGVDPIESYWFHHTLSDVINASLQNGFRLNFLKEYPHDISNFFTYFEESQASLPLCYAMIAQNVKIE